MPEILRYYENNEKYEVTKEKEFAYVFRTSGIIPKIRDGTDNYDR